MSGHLKLSKQHHHCTKTNEVGEKKPLEYESEQVYLSPGSLEIVCQQAFWQVNNIMTPFSFDVVYSFVASNKIWDTKA